MRGITKRRVKNLTGMRIIPKGAVFGAREVLGDKSHFDVKTEDGTEIHNVPAAWLEFGYEPKKPEKPQRFSYIFTELKEGSRFVSLEHIRHAICNCDQYPVELFDNDTAEGKLQAAVLDAVIEAIESVPVYIHQGGAIKKEELAEQWAGTNTQN